MSPRTGPEGAQEARSPLHLYMVQVKEKVKESPVSVRLPETRTAVTELRLDPAVVRAVDRAKLHRQRTLSECEGERGESQARSRRARQRTCSESSGLPDTSDGQMEARRTRFLSGSDG